jgi:predicted nucleic acid-binding protein
MADVFVLDACALIALLNAEPGADKIRNILNCAYAGEVEVVIHKLNLLEVYYDDWRAHGKERARVMLECLGELPFTVHAEITDKIFNEAGRLKATYKISLADSIALAEASARDGKLVTSDHREFDIIEASENIGFLWIR